VRPRLGGLIGLMLADALARSHAYTSPSITGGGVIAPPVRTGAKRSRHNPAPNDAPTGKRRRQWQ